MATYRVTLTCEVDDKDEEQEYTFLVEADDEKGALKAAEHDMDRDYEYDSITDAEAVRVSW